MKKARILKTLSLLAALCLLVALPMPFAFADGETSGTETFVSETQQTSGSKSTYRYKYTVGTPTGVSGADYMWTLGTVENPTPVVLKYDLNDDTISFKPYVNGQRNCNTLIDVYGSKDGVTWYQLVDAQYVGTGANYGFIADTASFVSPSDTTNNPWGGDSWGYYDWSNYNTVSMYTILADNPTKTVYLKFAPGGTPESGTEASELQGFGISAAWDVNGITTSGTETFASETQQTSGSKSTYRYKYTVGTPTGVSGADYMWTLGTVENPTPVVLKYDLNDATVSFTPYVNGQRNTNTLIDVYGSKDGVTWYQLVDAQYVGTGANYGFIADTATFVANADVTNKPWGTTWGYYNWSNYNLTNMNAVLADNPTKTVYLKFAPGGAPAEGTEACELQGFGISSAWDMMAESAVAGDAPEVAGVQIRNTDNALRFVFKVDNDMLADVEAKYGTVNFGAVMVNADAFTGDELVITDKTSGFGSGNPTTVVSTSHFVPEEYQSGYDGYTVYTMVIRGITSDAQKSTNVAMRAYIKATAADGSVRTIYSTDNSAHGGYVTTYNTVVEYYENMEG